MSMIWQRSDPSPALVVHPPGAASLDEAHAAIEQWEHYSRKPLDPAQRLAVELMMAETAERMWASRTTGRTESRQNGKGDEIEVVEAWGLTQRAEAIVHSAHEIPTAKSAHLRLVAHLEGHRDLRRLVKQVRYANGDQSIEMHNGGICAYRTRTAGGGRGLDDISRIVVDEAQHAQPEQLASATPILAANPNPQANFLGSAAIEGRSAWWWDMRKRALRADPGAFSWLEHSAEQIRLDVDGKVVTVAPDPLDPANWAIANPAYPHRIPHDFLDEQLRLLGPSLFAREHLGVWDPEPDASSSAIPADAWARCARPEAKRGEPKAHVIDAAPDGASAAIATSDGLTCAVLEHGPGTHWVGVRLIQLGITRVWLDPKSPAGALIQSLENAGITVDKVTAEQHAQACGAFLTAVTFTPDPGEPLQFQHLDQPVLNDAVAGAARRPYGQAWAWDRTRTSVDICPLVAVTIARWAALEAVAGPSVYETRDLRTV